MIIDAFYYRKKIKKSAFSQKGVFHVFCYSIEVKFTQDSEKKNQFFLRFSRKIFSRISVENFERHDFTIGKIENFEISVLTFSDKNIFHNW